MVEFWSGADPLLGWAPFFEVSCDTREVVASQLYEQVDLVTLKVLKVMRTTKIPQNFLLKAAVLTNRMLNPTKVLHIPLVD